MLSLFFGAGISFYPVTRVVQYLWRGYGICPRFLHGMATRIHIGKLIEAELRRQERPVSWFARKLYCERTNVYDIFKRRSIDTEMLLRISVVLQHDFFRYYSSEAEAVESESVGRQ